MPRRALNADEIACKDRLTAIWKVKKRELNLNQEKLAALMGWSSQGSVGQYFTGRIPLNTDAKIKFAEALGVSVHDIDPELKLPTDKTPTNSEEFLSIYGESLALLSHEEQLKLASKILLLAADAENKTN